MDIRRSSKEKRKELELRVAIRRSNKSDNRRFPEHGIRSNEKKKERSVRPSGGSDDDNDKGKRETSEEDYEALC